MIDAFSQTPSDLVDKTLTALIKFIVLGGIALIGGWTMITCWMITGERQASACRKAYFAALLRQ